MGGKKERIKNLSPLAPTPQSFDLGFSISKSMFADDHLDAHIKAMAVAMKDSWEKLAAGTLYPKAWGQWL